MEIRFLNHSLVKVQEKHLELLRNWRNNEVHEFMIYKDYINVEMQQKWFKSINNHNNFYFIIFKEELPVGLIDIKNIDWTNKTAETGIFIALQQHRTGEIPLIATVMSATFIAKIIQLESIYGKVLADNKHAIAYNLATGFKIIKNENNIITMSIENIKVAFHEIKKLKQKLCNIHKDATQKNIIIYISKESLNQDKSVEWIVKSCIKNQFRGFKEDEEFCIL